MTNYILEIWAKEQQIANEIKESIENKVEQFPSLSYEEIDDKDNRIILSISSNKPETIISCYALFEWDRDVAYIISDDLSHQLRQEAYPLIADIEVAFRKFINHAMTGFYGFLWWEQYMPKKIQNKIKGLEDKLEKKNQPYKHSPPLDFTFLLVSLVFRRLNKKAIS